MTHVATFVTNPLRPVLDQGMLTALAETLPRAHAPHWLAHGIAADIFFTPPQADAGTLHALAAALRAKGHGEPIDIFVQPAVLRRKRLLIADMDSTMIGEECLDELADFIGIRPAFARITEAAMRGEIAFEPALRERMILLAGLDVGAIEKILAERITLTPGARTLVATMRAHGAFTALLSSGLTTFTEPIAARLGFDKAWGNVAIIDNGKLSGHLAEPLIGRAAKRATLERLCKNHGIAAAETLAVGDGANDLEMLQAAGLGVAYRAKPIVAAAAMARIDHADLTALLYAQGFSRSEFVQGER